jgi:hypothetical protein
MPPHPRNGRQRLPRGTCRIQTLLWHKDWANGRGHLACDNSTVVDAIHKCSIAGPAIHPLQTILLIAADFDIDLVPFWNPLEENIVADPASWHLIRSKGPLHHIGVGYK